MVKVHDTEVHFFSENQAEPQIQRINIPRADPGDPSMYSSHPNPPSPNSRAASPSAGSRAASPSAGSRATSPSAGSRAASPSAGSRAASPSTDSRAGDDDEPTTPKRTESVISHTSTVYGVELSPETKKAKLQMWAIMIIGTIDIVSDYILIGNVLKFRCPNSPAVHFIASIAYFISILATTGFMIYTCSSPRRRLFNPLYSLLTCLVKKGHIYELIESRRHMQTLRWVLFQMLMEDAFQFFVSLILFQADPGGDLNRELTIAKLVITSFTMFLGWPKLVWKSLRKYSSKTKFRKYFQRPFLVLIAWGFFIALLALMVTLGVQGNTCRR